MAQSKKPRKAYRPRAIAIPPAFATKREADMKLGLRMRHAVDAAISGAGSWDDLMGCESELIVGLHLCRIATEAPDQHQVQAEALGPLKSALDNVAVAVASIKRRHRESGRIGCSGGERQELLTLADLMDEMRTALPRRLWLKAYHAAYDAPKLVVRMPDAEMEAVV